MNFITNSRGPGGNTISDKKWHISPQRSRQLYELALRKRVAVKPVQAPQGSGGITAPSTQPSGDGHLLFKNHSYPAMTEYGQKTSCCPPDKIILTSGQMTSRALQNNPFR